MCIGLPMRVVACDGAIATVERRGERFSLDVQRVGSVAIGTWVLAFQGVAVRTLADDEAAQTDAALAALEAALTGSGDIDTYFADLVDREPQLPDHLKGTTT
jgi:hydrogenase expression/formation protein HypC